MEQLSINELVERKSELIALKKSATKFTDALSILNINKENTTIKADNTTNIDSADTIYRTIVGNTYNWMDSHDDVHLEGIFTKSISERQKQILHLHDHLYRLTAKVGTPQLVYEKAINWTDLGVAKAGSTIALMMDTAIKQAFNSQMFYMYEGDEINQHSVGMQYVIIELAVNDNKYKDEFATWIKYRPLIANGEVADKKGFFWAVKEAKLIEISAVISGSNELTPTLQPVKTIEVEEPIQVKQGIDYNFLINNFKL